MKTKRKKKPMEGNKDQLNLSSFPVDVHGSMDFFEDFDIPLGVKSRNIPMNPMIISNIEILVVDWAIFLFQVSSAAIRSQIELVTFEPAWLIPAFFFDMMFAPKASLFGPTGPSTSLF